MAASQVLWFLYSNLDVTIAGKLLGKEIVGVYSVALTISWIPLRKIMPIVTKVSFSAFSRIQNDRQRVRNNVLRAVKYSFGIFLPVFWGIALVAPDGIPIGLGDHWLGVITPLRIICVILPLRAITALIPPALFGVGRPMVNVVNTGFAVPIMGVAFYVGAQYGAAGLASAWLLAYPVVFAFILLTALPILGVSHPDFWSALRAPLVAGLAMVAVVLSAQFLATGVSPLIRLVFSIACGAVAYPSIIYLIDRSTIIEFRELFSR